MVISPRFWLTKSMAKEKRQRETTFARWTNTHLVFSFRVHYLAQCPGLKAAIPSSNRTSPKWKPELLWQPAKVLCSALHTICVQQLQDRHTPRQTHTHIKLLVIQMDLHIQRSSGGMNNPCKGCCHLQSQTEERALGWLWFFNFDELIDW